jgi:hypothetical protein
MRQFQVGDLVSYVRWARSGTPAGAFQVVAYVPREDSATGYHYRIKSAAEPTERVASEDVLEAYS